MILHLTLEHKQMALAIIIRTIYMAIGGAR